MALFNSSLRLSRLPATSIIPALCPQSTCRRYASSSSSSSSSSSDALTPALRDLQELETESSFSSAPIPSQELAENFDPVARSKSRKEPLPPSRYHFRPPKYYRGPFHPHRSPPEWDPSSRLFVPGPFTLPRAEQTYDSAIAADIFTLSYVHCPPGFKPPPPPERLRQWDESSPYHKNRPRRGPRGGDVLRLLRKPVTFNDVPKIERITVNTFVKDALKGGSGPLHVAGMAIQAITNKRVTTHKTKSNVPSWGVIKDRTFAGITAEMRGEDMYHFLGKLIDVVLPRVKDWPGIKGSSGDSSGNITFGLEPSMVALFPEIEVNYDMYPPEKIPGCHITIHTTARSDKDGRLLLSAFGLPFHGKFVN